MALHFITGISGSGKSSVLNELKRRGYEAYDSDEAGPITAKWHNEQTGFVHAESSIKAKDRTPEFLSVHSWKVDRQEVEDLAKQAEKKTIFLCGLLENVNEFVDLFKSVFTLTIDDETLTHRLTTRTNHDWGKSSQELQLTLKWHHLITASHKKSGYVVIDATQPLDKVVNGILSYVHDR